MGVCALEEVEENVSLRKAGQQWLASHEVIHKPLTNSSQEGRLTLIARCHACQSCTLQYCFSFDSDGRMRVEKVGSCGDSKNAEVLKRARAKAFAQHTPAQAVKLMRRQGIPEDEIPEEHQVKNQRYKLSKDKKLSVVPVESLDELRKFVANPPKGVCFLDEHMVVSEEKIVIPFCLEDSEKTNQILQDSELAAFLMDFTFQVNKEGLVVGSAGLERCETISDGNCQFIALAFSSGTPVQHQHLRERIVMYMRHTKDLFTEHFDPSYGDFDSYLHHMSQDGSYGDELTLQCAAHLFLRPIRVISPKKEHDREFLPPECVSQDCWGAPLYLSFVAWNHYEATAPMMQQESG